MEINFFLGCTRRAASAVQCSMSWFVLVALGVEKFRRKRRSRERTRERLERKRKTEEKKKGGREVRQDRERAERRRRLETDGAAWVWLDGGGVARQKTSEVQKRCVLFPPQTEKEEECSQLSPQSRLQPRRVSPAFFCRPLDFLSFFF